VSIALIAPDRDLHGLVRALEEQSPETPVEVWPNLGRLDRVEFAVCWRPPVGVLATLPALKAVSSLGAGIDSILNDPTLPADLPVGRLSGSHLAQDMAGWVLAHVTSIWFDLARFEVQQAAGRWAPSSPQRVARVGLMGTGAVARPLIASLTAWGCEVHGWNRRGRAIRGLTVHKGPKGLIEMASAVDFLVCLLPLTSATTDILDQRVFEAMQPGTTLINAGRGQHLVEKDLLEALERDRPGRAVLDVFRREPLPVDHPFWQHPRVRISPHCAAISQDKETANLILRSYREVIAGRPPLGEANREQGY